MEIFDSVFSGIHLSPWLETSVAFLFALLGALILHKALWKRLTRWAQSNQAKWDDELLFHLSAPTALLLVIAAAAIAWQTAPPQARHHPLWIFGVKSALIIAIIWLLERGLVVAFQSRATIPNLSATTRALCLTIGRILLVSIGALITLDTAGVSITPLLASLGVGSVAVALALQDTLSNFFGGLYLLIDKPLREGDLVKIGDIEGSVEKIGWRSTRIRLPSDNTAILPNNQVASAKLVNYDLPSSESSITVELGVAQDSDLDKVERVASEVAKDVISRMEASVKTFDPLVRFNAFGESSIRCIVIFRVHAFVDGYFIKHNLIKALHHRFLDEGITIAQPRMQVSWPGTASPSATQHPQSPPVTQPSARLDL